MKSRILLIGGAPDGWVEQWVEPETSVDIQGFGTGLPHLEYNFYEHLAADQVIRLSVSAERDGFDAIVIGCFYDPGLRVARELVRIPVVGVSEATLHVAAMLSAGKFSILVGRRNWIPRMAENARSNGFESRIASWRVMGLTVPDMRDREKTQAAILREARAAVEEDLAEVICLGCTGMAGQAQYAQEALGVPVLDPVVMGLKMAELRADLWKRFGISHSKIGGYAPPPDEELAAAFERAYGHRLGARRIAQAVRRIGRRAVPGGDGR